MKLTDNLNQQDWFFIGVVVVLFVFGVAVPALRSKAQPEPRRRDYRRYE